MTVAGELAGKAAIVTGATRGIGLAAAQALAQAGAGIVLTGRTVADGERAAAAIKDAGGRAVFIAADQGSADDWTRVAAAAESEFGRLDILIANAGVTQFVPLEQLSLAAFRDLNRINLKGVFLGLQHAVAAMRRHGKGGSVVFISSIVGKVGVMGYSHYAAAKSGVRLLAKAAALELGPEKIRVNAVLPGMVATDMTAGFDEAALAPRIPLGRFGKVEELAGSILFLASDRSKFMTGAELTVDGGWTMQ